MVCGRKALQFFFFFFIQLIRKSWNEKKKKELIGRGLKVISFTNSFKQIHFQQVDAHLFFMSFVHEITFNILL